MQPNVKKIIQTLNLIPHPEGGYYSEVYRSEYEVSSAKHEGTIRRAGTSIYYLLDKNNYSAWHKVSSDETWHHYAGCPIEIYVINEHGELSISKIGHIVEHGLNSQVTVKANQWFAAKPIVDNHFTLVGCTVYPGFDFRDFCLASADDISALKQLCPSHNNLLDCLFSQKGKTP